MATVASPITRGTGASRLARLRTALGVVLGGLFAGAAVGAIARGWMRLLAEDPEFTLGGTVSIVVVFGLAGLGHAVARTARARAWRRSATTVARVFGAVLTLPLFGGAGVVMFPTVLGASVAVWRRAWPRPARALAVLVALPAPLMLLAEVRHTGVAPAPVLGLALLAATYALIVWSMGSIVAPDDRRPLDAVGASHHVGPDHLSPRSSVIT